MEDFLSLNPEIEADVQESLDICAKTRLLCFAHSLQLVLRDGPTEALTSSKLIVKASRLSSLLHKSTVFKNDLKQNLGTND